MSSLAAFRGSPQSNDLRKLAEKHAEHDLKPEDRELLKKATSRITWPTTLGSALGLSLGLYMAFRVRKLRVDAFRAFKAAEQPTHVMFANGRSEPIPDITRYMQPTPLGDAAAHIFFGLGGLFLGGEIGLLTGTTLASRTIRKDPEAQKRIETAFRRFRADALRQEADRLDATSEGSVWD